MQVNHYGGVKTSKKVTTKYFDNLGPPGVNGKKLRRIPLLIVLLSCLIRSLLKVKTQLNFFLNLDKFSRICINPGGFIERKVLSVESFCCVGFFFFFVQFVYKLAQPLTKRHLPYMKRFFKDWTVNIKGLKKLLSS